MTQLSEDEKKHVLAYALLHDIGHTPYSHELEEIADLDQMEAAKEIVSEESFAEALDACDINLETLLTFFNKESPLRAIVSGKVLGTEKLAYLLRDGIATGKGGYDNIEGLVMKNTKNNRMVKIVELKRFGELNAKNWANRNELKKQRKELFKELTDAVCNNCDIITLPSKREQSLRSYLAISHKTKFESMNEMLAVLVNDMKEEVDLKDSIDDMTSILTQYTQKISEMKNHIDITLDKKHFSDTKNMYDKEISEIKEFIESISQQKTPQLDMVKFMLGSKTFNTLKEKYLN